MSVFKPEFVYFDLDDTLLDHKKAERNGLKDVHKHFEEVKKVPLEALEDTYHQINKGLWQEYGAGLIDRHELHRRRFEETFEALEIDTSLQEEAGKVYMKYYRTHWEWVPGAESAYARIASEVDTGIITNGFAETQWMKIDQFGFRDKARHIVISEEFGVMKPQPAIFDHASDLCGVEREKILYVGDSLSSDVEGGRAAGWKVAWYVDPVDDAGHVADIAFNDFQHLLKWLNMD